MKVSSQWFGGSSARELLPELSRICNVVAIITKGKLRAFGKLDDIMRQITQRRTFEVQLVSTPQMQQATRVISECLSVDASAVAGSDTERMLRFETDWSDEQLSGLLERLIQQQVGVAQFREVPTDLEDAFLSVTRETQQMDAESEKQVEPSAS